jgi:F0F1-type ATP synthase assembly protein I
MSVMLGVEFVFIGALLAVLAFFVFDTASRAKGRLHVFGNALGVWLLVLILVALVILVVAPILIPAPSAPMRDVWLNES